MDPKSSGRQKNVTEGGKGVRKRGEGLNTGGPVGRKDGYAGRTQNGGPVNTGSQRGTGSGGPGSQGSRPRNPLQDDPRYNTKKQGQRPMGGGSGGFGGSGGSGSSGGGTGMNPKIILILVVVVIILAVLILPRLMNNSGSASSNYDNYGSGYTGQNGGSGTGSGYDSGSSGSAYSAGGSDILGMLSGYTGSNSVSEGWSSAGDNTAVLNRDVADGARPKRTQIYGGGADTVTIMVYMCGTDLESKSGMASKDLAEMCAATLSDNVNILVYTGGCKAWKTSGISSSVNQIYKVGQGGITRLVDNDGSKSMTDPATLTSFIKWCAANFPANRNDLIFWDHGGGSISGYGYDEKNIMSSSMNLAGINKALSDAGVTFDFIGFDACLMATLETALVTSNYADYLIASEETEPGIGWYYTDWLTSLSKDPSQSTLDTGKNIIDGFVTTCAQKCRGQKATLSMTDLAELETTIPEKLAAFSEATGDLIQSDNYQQVSDARANCREFAISSKIDQIDLVDFADGIGTDAAKALSDTLLDAVKYNRTSSNMTNSYGLSIYFPYKKASKVDTVTGIYKQIGMDESYAKCIKSFAGLETVGQVSAGGVSSPMGSLFDLFSGSYGSSGSSYGYGSSGSGSYDSYGSSGFGSSASGYGSSGYGSSASGMEAISSLLSSFLSGDREVNGIDRAATEYMDDADAFNFDKAVEYVSMHQFDPSYLVWTENEDGQHVMAIPDEQWDLIQSLQVNVFYDDGEGFLDLGLDNQYEFTDDGRLIGETDGTWISIDNQPVAFYYESTISDNGAVTVTGRVPAILNGDRVELILVFDDTNPNGYIAGARYVYVDGETETVAKTLTELNEGDVIDFICDYYSYDQTYQNTYYLGDPITYTEDLLISYTYVGDDLQVNYLLTDLYDQEYWTPVVPS